MKTMKTIAMAVAMLTTGATANANEVKDTIKIESPNYVTIVNDSNGYYIAVKGRKGNPDYTYETTQTFDGDGEVEVKREVDFTVPFSRYWDEREKKRKRKFSPHWSGMGLGFCNVVSTSASGSGNVSVNMSESAELFFNFGSASCGLGSGFGLFTGMGIDWRNFRMDGDLRFAKNGNKVTIEAYPEGAEINFSRLKIFSVTVPFMLEWQLRGTNSFFVNAGPVVNINGHASLLTRYKLDGEKVKIKEKGVHYLPLTVDFMGQIGFDDFGFYVKYSPCRLIQKDYGPKMCPLTCGMLFRL